MREQSERQKLLSTGSQIPPKQARRAPGGLGDGVVAAIKTLGNGFLSLPANQPLKDKLRRGRLGAQDYYHQLICLVYRLLFLFMAEDRDLLFKPEIGPEVRDRYHRLYSATRLRRQSVPRAVASGAPNNSLATARGTNSQHLFGSLRLVMAGLEGGGGGLSLPALGGFFFSPAALPDLASCDLADRDLLDAVSALIYLNDRQVRRPVDYASLRPEELGGVYEALLELHPVIHFGAWCFELGAVAGSDRKKTGSYYTPESLVECLLGSALDPALDQAAAEADPEEAILSLTVCDPTCGSGHFLLAAARRIAARLASVRTGQENPAPEALRAARRDVIGRCLYGVDINPVAVELCKVSLWLEAAEAGQDLSFLDHRIQCGNALLGATPALLAQGIPDKAFRPIERDDPATCRAARRQNSRERQRRTQPSGGGPVPPGVLASSRLLADAWCAAFVWRKTRKFPHAITEAVFRRIAENEGGAVESWLVEEVKRLAGEYRFFHWHLAFPEVFDAAGANGRFENEAAGWNGGFDVVLGNPPWERIKLQEKEWFASCRNDIASAPNAAVRRRMIEDLGAADGGLLDAFREDRRRAEGQSHFIRNAGRYPLCGRGDVNTYALFAETNRLILAAAGRVGCVVPSGVATDDTTKHFFQDLMGSRSLISLYDFENRDGIFPGVHRSYKFCLLTLAGPARPARRGAEFTFFARSTGDLRAAGRHFTLSADELTLLNPHTRTCPVFRSRRDAELTKAIYRRIPVLIAGTQPVGRGWGVQFLRMFDMSNDSGLFCPRGPLAGEDWRLLGNVFGKGEAVMLPLYEAKMLHHFDHRWASHDGLETAAVTAGEKADPGFTAQPRYWVSQEEVSRRLRGRCDWPWVIAYRWVARSTDERTLIASPAPLAGYGNSSPLILPAETTRPFSPALAANLCSFILDYIARQKLGGANMTYGILSQLAVLQPITYLKAAGWSPGEPLLRWLLPRVLELTYTARELAGFAADCGYAGEPFGWDDRRRFLLRCELDAAYFHLYGIGRGDVDYVMETFPIVRRKDKRAWGEYRTKRAILETYDEMRRAIETGATYQTCLDPPPARGWQPPVD